MAYYESIFVLRQDLTDAQVKESVKKYESIITENKGKVEKTESWGLRPLAYVIKKNSKGHYTLFQMECDAETVKELDRRFRLDEDVIRHMILKIKEISKAPSPILQQTEDSKVGFDSYAGNEKAVVSENNKEMNTEVEDI